MSAITESKDETKVIKKDEKELKKVEKKAIKKESKLEIEETLLDFKEGFAAENEQRLLSSLINLRQVCAAGDAVEIKAALETVEKNMNTTLDGRATNRLIRHIKRDGEFFVKDLNDLENYINRIKDKGDLYALKKNSDTLSKELEACITELEDLKNNVVVISGSLNEIAVLNKSLNKFENTYNPSKKIKSVFDTIKKNLKSETPIDPSWFNDIIGIETERSNIFKSEISYENIADNAVEVLKNHAKNNFHHMDATITELNKTLRKELNDFAKKMGHNMKTYNAVSTEYKKIKKQELVLDSILKPIVKITASQVYDRGQPVDVPEKHDEELALVIKTIFDSLVMIEKEIVAIDETDAEIYHKYYLFATDKKKNLIHDAEGSMLDRSVRVKNYYSKIAELLGFSVGIHDA